MDLIWGLLIFFIFITVIFLVIALMFPEWVGITGKRALEIQKHQSGDHFDADETKLEVTSDATLTSSSKDKSHQ